MSENRRAVLRAPVGALLVFRGRVVGSKEEFNQGLVADFVGIEEDHEALGVPGCTGAHGSIGRRRGPTAGVADASV